MKKILLGLLVCAGFSACTNDDIVATTGTQKVFDGDVAYMTVRINDVGSSTRATEGNYSTGTAAEYAVNDAYFYFYDEAGVYVSQAEVWDGGTPTSDDPGANNNIEFKGETVIILEGLSEKGYPKYVVTVLNQPSGFTPGTTLAEMSEKLADASAEGIMQGTNTYFTMSTSSYVPEDASADYYFVTELTEDDFFSEPIDMEEVVPVDIYVERLAAKVGVDVSEDLSNTTITTDDGRTLYKLNETVAGAPNEETDEDGEGAQDIYVEIVGWGINATAKHSNIVKDINPEWTDTELGFTWNIPGDYRSYWGRSYNYGLGSIDDFPTTSGGASYVAGEGELLNDYLNYISLETTNDVASTAYCTENTNTPALLASKNSSAITSVLLKAIVCDENGDPIDMVRYQGELFTNAAYLDYVMDELNQNGEINVYTAAEEDGATIYTQIDGSYIELAKTDGTTTRYDGYVVVVSNDEAWTEDTYYYNTGTFDSDGNPVFEAYASVAAAEEYVEEALEVFNAAHLYVNAFTGGEMYYNIPIEHLNNNAAEAGAAYPLLEANYGVVRNHWYNLTITALENVGKGIYDPDEVIIPNNDDEQFYYVGANINILSWKLVSQDVAL